MSNQGTLHLPDGQDLTIERVFGGLFFRSSEPQNVRQSAFPAGWTVVLQSENYADNDVSATQEDGSDLEPQRRSVHRYRQPALHNDSLYISSISNPSSHEFKPAASPTRATAMMLWTSLYWYFQQPEPSPYLTDEASKLTPDAGKPRGEWKIWIKREGIFSSRYLLQKLERMGLVSSEESSVGTDPDEQQEGWAKLFVSRRAFWQMSPRLFLFTLAPAADSSHPSRTTSPSLTSDHKLPRSANDVERSDRGRAAGPYASGSHLPTYFPPPPLQYTMTNEVRHPVRPKPPRQGETFYIRHVPSVNQYLSFRVASLSKLPVPFAGPSITSPTHGESASENNDTMQMSDVQLLHKWMNEPRVAAFWGCSGGIEVQDKFLRSNLESRHSFPVIGCWDGKPFGYFEIYWVKEDILAKRLGFRDVDDYDRGVHVLVGEQDFRGIHRLKVWITALAHYLLTHDYRTNSIVLEPRVDNVRFIEHLEKCGFQKEREVTFPHKQSALVRLRRDTFEAPAI